MNEILTAIVVGVIEGLTEFLPVSSTGHMILAFPLLGVNKADATWGTLLWVSQLGAILAVIAYFAGDLWRRTVGLAREPSRWRGHLFTKLAVAMIPTIGIALLLHDYAERYLENVPSVGVALIVGAVVILWIDRRARRDGEQSLDDVTLKQACLIGVIQCLSMWSGISRSGASILGGMALGLTPRVATEFSFYLAIPTMLAAAAKTLWDHRDTLTSDGAAVIAVGTAAAFVTALAVVWAFLAYVRGRRFTPFAVYRIILGVVVLAAWGAGWVRDVV